jgi:hypothetical protein
MSIYKSFFSLTLIIAFCIQSIVACICEKPPPPCYAYSQYEAVFVGTVKEVKFDEAGFRRKIQVTVDRNYKGLTSDEVFTETGGFSCDFEGFKVNKKFLIYGGLAENDKTFFGTSACSSSKTFRDDLIDLEFLNSLSNPTPNYWIWGTFT